MNTPELPTPSYIDSEQLIQHAKDLGLQLDMRSLGVYIETDQMIRPAYPTFSLSPELCFRAISLASYSDDDLKRIENQLAVTHWEPGVTFIRALDEALSDHGIPPLSELPLVDLPSFLYRANFGLHGGRLAHPDAETLEGPLVSPLFESFDGLPHLIVRAHRIRPADFDDPVICALQVGQIFPKEEVDRFFRFAGPKEETAKELTERSERSHLITIAMLASMLSERAPKFKKGNDVNAQTISEAIYAEFGDPSGCKPQTVAKRIRLGLKALEEDT